MELLFDDLWLDRKAGVQRVLGAPKKEDGPIIRPEKSWESGVGTLHSVFYDEEARRFKLWYRTALKEPPRRTEAGSSAKEESSERVTGKRRNVLCYAESADGVNWERPALGLFDLHGNRGNNILRDTTERDSVYYNIIKDPSDPNPARRYKAIGFDDCASTLVEGVKIGSAGVCVAYSSDGLRWPEGPKLIMSTSDLTDADCVLPRREPNTGKYVAFLRPRTHPKRRFIAYSESDDFDHWTYPRMLITPDAGDDEWVEYYGLTATIVGRWRIGVLWVYHNNPDFSPMTNELVYSRDGLHYHRAMPNVPFLPLGPAGAFDSRMVSANSLFQHGPEFRLYYGGSNHEHGADRHLAEMQHGRVEEGQPHRGGLGLARIAGLNFCGLRAPMDGLVETKWLCNYGKQGVEAYAEIQKDGWIRAEILDQYGNVIPGWDRSQSRAQQGTDGKLRFSWGGEMGSGPVGKTDLTPFRCVPPGHVVKVRFHLHKATLYGFCVGDENALPVYVA
jgi:hypothetical protein